MFFVWFKSLDGSFDPRAGVAGSAVVAFSGREGRRTGRTRETSEER
jgi:hypothetical protein